MRLLFDTGATYTMIAPKSALAIGIDPALSQKRLEVITASGVEYLPLVVIPEVECLGIKVKRLDVVCHELPPQSAVEGLLGMNFLVHWSPFQKLLKNL